MDIDDDLEENEEEIYDPNSKEEKDAGNDSDDVGIEGFDDSEYHRIKLAKRRSAKLKMEKQYSQLMLQRIFLVVEKVCVVFCLFFLFFCIFLQKKNNVCEFAIKSIRKH